MDKEADFADSWGGGHDWKLATGPEGEFRIEPRRLDAVVIILPAIGLIWLAIVWLSRTDPELKIAATVMGLAANAAITAFLAWHNRHQQQLGPFLVFDGRDLILRRGRRVPVSELANVDVLRRWDDRGENGYTPCHYLMLNDTHGQSVAVVGSISRRGIWKAKTAIEERLAAAGWTARPTGPVPSSGSDSVK